MVKLAGLKNTDNVVSCADTYAQWRNFNKESLDNFYILPNGIKKYLSYFDGKALNLYLYYCLHSNNETGESWHSTKTCARELGVSERSINNWNLTLEDVGLIKRISTNRSSKSSFLLPISDFIYHEKNKGVIEYLKDYHTSSYQRDIDGDLVAVFNLFQWRKNKDTGDYTDPYNTICLCFERVHRPKKSNEIFVVRKFVLLDEGFVKQTVSTSNNGLYADVFRIKNKEDEFDLQKELEDKGLDFKTNVVFDNLFINSKFNLKDFYKKDILDLLVALSVERANLGEVDVIE